MEAVEISASEAMEKVEKLLEKSKAVFLATNGSHGGHPNVRAMAVARNEGVQTIWFATSLDSGKIIELIKDSKATLYGYAPRTSAEFRLWGDVVILDDAASKEHIWQEEFKEHFPGGADDPNLRVLRFDVNNGAYNTPEGKTGQFTV